MSDDKKVPLLIKRVNVNKFKEIFSPGIKDGTSEEKFKKHFGSIDQLLNILKTDKEKGLNSADAADKNARIKEYGIHKLDKENKIRNFFVIFRTCLCDPILGLLLISSLVIVFIGFWREGLTEGWIEGGAIFITVFLAVCIISFFKFQQQKGIGSLNYQICTIKQVNVIRNSSETRISSNELLVGDILHVTSGDILDVDGVLLTGKINMDESSLTGESSWAGKVPCFTGIPGTSTYMTPFILSGTQVEEGEGTIVVCAVGKYTFSRRSIENLRPVFKEEGSVTPLQSQLNSISCTIGDVGFFMAIVIGSLLIVNDVIIRWRTGDTFFDSAFCGKIANTLAISIAIIIVAIPEGLPMAVTIALTYTVPKMKDKNCLVKRPNKIEVLGNVDNICIGNIDAITSGKLEVQNIFIWGKDYQSHDIPKTAFSLIQNTFIKTNSAKVSKDGEVLGHKLDCSILTFLLQKGFEVNTEQDKPELYLPFHSSNKYIANIYKYGDNAYKLYIKGAPERVLPMCGAYETENGPIEMTPQSQNLLRNQGDMYALQRLRVLVFASKILSKREVEETLVKYPTMGISLYEDLARNSIFILMAAIRDPIQIEEVVPAVRTCKEAGIAVRIMTGKDIYTALSISEGAGIINNTEYQEALNLFEKREREPATKSPLVLDRAAYNELSGHFGMICSKTTNNREFQLNHPEEFKETVKNLKIITQTNPEEKVLLVAGLKQVGCIVAFCGKSSNDESAMKQANIAFALGTKGSDVVKDAADIILLDDSFASLVTACGYGRNVFDCVRKYIQFQLTVNLVVVSMTFLGGLLLRDSPFTIIELLWINLIMDSFASFALATEKPSCDIMKQKPYMRNAHLITPGMKLNILCQAVFQIIILTGILLYGDIIFEVSSDRSLQHSQWNNANGYQLTIMFNIFVFMQVFNSINCRKINQGDCNVFSGIVCHWQFLFVQIITVGVQILIVTFGGKAFRTHPLSLTQHFLCIGIASLSFIFGFITKMIPIDANEEDAEEEKSEDSSPLVNVRGFLHEKKE